MTGWRCFWQKFNLHYISLHLFSPWWLGPSLNRQIFFCQIFKETKTQLNVCKIIFISGSLGRWSAFLHKNERLHVACRNLVTHSLASCTPSRPYPSCGAANEKKKQYDTKSCIIYLLKIRTVRVTPLQRSQRWNFKHWRWLIGRNNTSQRSTLPEKVSTSTTLSDFTTDEKKNGLEKNPKKKNFFWLMVNLFFQVLS